PVYSSGYHLDLHSFPTRRSSDLKNAFRIILSDRNVKTILINIFGGIMRCDIIARGVVAAVQEMGGRGRSAPVVVRLEGTNVELGKQILRDSKLEITPAEGLADAARKAVEAAR